MDQKRHMPRIKKRAGDRCYLSPPCADDAENWARWESDLAVALPLGDEAYVPSSVEAAREAIARVQQNREHVFTIVDVATDDPIGRGMLFNVDAVNRSAMLGILIGETGYWGQGYGQEATRLLVEYGFCLLNLNSIMLGTFDFNQRARHCYEQVGFREIGRRRQARCIGGHWHDAVLMDLLAGEYEPRYTARIFEAIGTGATGAPSATTNTTDIPTKGP
jgi:RimJ/RimL family protein N-acetyltransferase